MAAVGRSSRRTHSADSINLIRGDWTWGSTGFAFVSFRKEIVTHNFDFESISAFRLGSDRVAVERLAGLPTPNQRRRNASLLSHPVPLPRRPCPVVTSPYRHQPRYRYVPYKSSPFISNSVFKSGQYRRPDEKKTPQVAWGRKKITISRVLKSESFFQ